MKQELKDMLLELGVFKRVEVPNEQTNQVIPEELRRDSYGKHYVIDDGGLSNEEINTFLNAKQTMLIRTIHYTLVTFFLFFLIATFLVLIV